MDAIDDSLSVLPESVILAGIHCTLEIDRPRRNVILLKFSGRDIGEFGDAPFWELERDFDRGLPVEIFLHAWEVRSASIEVSSAWAHWMMEHRALIYRFSILCRSSFVQMTAEFVQRFTAFADQMRIYYEKGPFELALGVACGAASPERE